MSGTPTIGPRLKSCYETVDVADATENIQRALRAVEALVEPTLAENAQGRNLTVSREDLYCLLGVLNTRLDKDLEAVRAAARNAARIA